VLDVVHEIDGERVLRPGVERREDARHAAGLDDARLVEARIQRQLAHVLRTPRRVEPHVGDGRQRDPLPQPFDRRLPVGLDRRDDLLAAWIVLRRCGRPGGNKCQGQRGRDAERELPIEPHCLLPLSVIHQRADCAGSARKSRSRRH